MSSLAAARARFEAELADRPAWLQQHTQRVIDGVVQLARIHELDPERCATAAAGHDIFRHLKGEQLLQRSRAAQITIDDAEIDAPIILHGPLAAVYAERELAIDDPELLDNIRHHTTAHPDISAEGLAVFLADKIDPHKIAGDPGLAAVAAAARHDLVAAAALFLERRLAQQLAGGALLHPLAVASRNAFLTRCDERLERRVP